MAKVTGFIDADGHVVEATPSCSIFYRRRSKGGMI